MIVGMDRRFAAACAGQLLIGIAGDHFIDVHVGLSARSRLPDNQRKLIVQFARSDRDGRVLYGVGALLIQIMPGLYLSGRLLDAHTRMAAAAWPSLPGAPAKIPNDALPSPPPP